MTAMREDVPPHAVRLESDQLDRFGVALEAARAGSAQLVLCVGEPGSGRTTLLRALAAEAERRGAHVRWPARWEGTECPAGWLGRQITGLPSYAVGAGQVGEALRRLAATSTAMLVLDDADRLDLASANAATDAISAPGPNRLIVCAALTRDTVETRSAAAAALIRVSAATISPAPLRRADVVTLVESCLAGTDDEFADAVLARSGGNALLASELVRDEAVRRLRASAASPPQGDPATLAPDWLQLVHGRLARLSATERVVVETAAIAGLRVRVADLSAASELSVGACADAVASAIRVGLMASDSAGTATLRHDALRAAVAQSLPAERRYALCRRLAESLSGSPGPLPAVDRLAQLATYWRGAAAAGAGAEASRWAQATAAAAADGHRYSEAVELYALAVEHADPLKTVEGAELQLAQAAAAVAAGQLDVARQACRNATETAARIGSARLSAAAALTLSPIGEPGWDGELHRWCTDAVERWSQPDRTRVQLLARRAQAATYLGLYDEADQVSAEALHLADSTGDAEVIIDALTARQLTKGGPSDAAELARLAEQMVELGRVSGRADAEMWGRLWRVDTHFFAGRLDAVAAELPGIQRCAEHSGGPYGHWHLLQTRAALALARAEFSAAQALHRDALQQLADIDHPAVHGSSVAFGVLIGHHLGPAAAVLEPDAWDFGTDPRWAFGAHLLRAFALVDAGRVDEAAASYARCAGPRQWPSPRLAGPILAAYAIPVATATGALDDLPLLREWLLPYADGFAAAGGGGTNFLGPVSLWIGRCDLALGHYDAAAEAFASAAARCADVGAPGFGVEAATLRARTQADAGRPAEARRLAQAALPIARGLGMAPWVTALETLSGGPSGAERLSAREREVAALVAAGLSNRAIADELVISERTAQNHVQHILVKLGFTNRAQIAAWATQRQLR